MSTETHNELSLSDIAFLYTSTSTGKTTGIRFAATIPDAQKFCSHPTSRGTMHGHQWAYFYTSAENYVRYHSGSMDAYGDRPLTLDMRGCTDNGKWDKRIAATGCKKIPLEHIPALMERHGVTVLNAPKETK